MEFNLNYLAVEGPDGTGKTTLAQALAELTKAVFTYEPYGESIVTKSLRKFALDKAFREEVNAESREYIMLANRAISTEYVRKALLEGHKIISDRSLVSGMVYAKVASNYTFQEWWDIAYKAFKVHPEVVVYVQVAETKINAKENDIYDMETNSFHTDIKNTFPEALEWMKEKLGFPVVEFTNDFTVAPEVNAQNLLHALTEAQKK